MILVAVQHNQLCKSANGRKPAANQGNPWLSQISQRRQQVSPLIGRKDWEVPGRPPARPQARRRLPRRRQHPPGRPKI